MPNHKHFSQKNKTLFLKLGFCCSQCTNTAVKAYLFYNLYIFDPFGPPLQLRLPQCVQTVQIQTHEIWIRLEEENFRWYKGLFLRTFWEPTHFPILHNDQKANHKNVYMLALKKGMAPEDQVNATIHRNAL